MTASHLSASDGEDEKGWRWREEVEVEEGGGGRGGGGGVTVEGGGAAGWCKTTPSLSISRSLSDRLKSSVKRAV